MFELPPAIERPDRYVLIERNDTYHVLGAWGGSYTCGSSWRLSTPVAEVIRENEDYRVIRTKSGSEYTLNRHEAAYGLAPITSDVFAQFKEAADATGEKFSVVPFECINEIFDKVKQ